MISIAISLIVSLSILCVALLLVEQSEAEKKRLEEQLDQRDRRIEELVDRLSERKDKSVDTISEYTKDDPIEWPTGNIEREEE